MKVLMFGWEFPPHISGGLGTACYGLTKGLSKFKNIDILFVVPKTFGDEEQNKVKLIGANGISISQKKIDFRNLLKKITFLEVSSRLVPYISPEEYEKQTKEANEKDRIFIQTEHTGKISFSGGYGTSLFQEIANYAIVASVIAKENSFEIIHAHDWLTYPAGIAAKSVSGKPLVLHVHATDFDRSGGNVSPEVYEIERRGMEAADKIIAVSNFTKNTIIEKYHINPTKIETVYNAVDPPENEERLKIKKNVNEKIVTFLGRVTLQKGPEYFIEVAYKVLQKLDNVRFVMAGSGDMLNKMIVRAAKLGITDKFHFTGFLKGDDVAKLFSISDVYVMPSVSEPFGISPLEAMQSNVPVIISHQSGVSEILNHAIKVHFWDIDAMADAIHAILQYDALAKMFKKFGKSEVDKLKWEKSAAKVNKIYQSILN